MTPAQPEIEESATLHKLLDAIKMFCEEDPQMPIQRAGYFLWVALHPHCQQADVGDYFKMSTSSRSRNKDILSDFQHGQTKPYKLIEVEKDPATRKETNLLSITDKGRSLCRRLILSLSGKRD